MLGAETDLLRGQLGLAAAAGPGGYLMRLRVFPRSLCGGPLGSGRRAALLQVGQGARGWRGERWAVPACPLSGANFLWLQAARWRVTLVCDD